jgi:iron(III) transport system permease protein
MNVAALILTLQLVAGSVVIAVPIGCSVAIAITVLSPWRRIHTLGWLAMIAVCVLPLYLHAAAWEAAAGKFGVLRWTQTTAANQPFSGLFASIWIHGITGAAWVALTAGFGLSRLSAELVDAASLDSNPLRRWGLVFLPAVGPWIAIGALWVAALAATEMTVVDLYGVRTLADEFYLLYAAQPSISAVVQTLAPSVPLAIGLAMILRSLIGATRNGAGGAPSERFATERRPWQTRGDGGAARRRSVAIAWLLTAWLLAVIVLMLGIPLAGLFASAGRVVSRTPLSDGSTEVVRSWQWTKFWDSITGSAEAFSPEYRWTLTIGFAMGLFASMVAMASIAVFGGKNDRLRWCDTVYLVAVMIPGPMVALATVWVFRRDLPGLDTLYGQTLVPTMIALLPRSGAAAYLVLRVATKRLDPAVRAAAMIECPGRFRRYWRIDLPLILPAVLVAIGASGAVAMADVPATLPVLPPGVSTVGTRLFGLLHSGARSQEAALAIGFLLIVLVLSILFLTLEKVLRPRRPKPVRLR